MAIRSSLTPVEAIDLVRSERLVLPGIQRPFVWRPAQIEALFDSLMRGYPIGSMLVWSTHPKDNPHLRFLKLVTDYTGKDTLPAGAHTKTTAGVYAVLDGQQRLTALNIGLRGSHSGSEHGQPRLLHIDLDVDEPDAGSEGNRYRLSFRMKSAAGEGAWFLISDARKLGTDLASLNKAIEAAGHATNPQRRRVLRSLAKALNTEELIRVVVESGELDRVLNIFARVNKGGTQLTYVDLLVSTATARWKTLDARSEIVDLRKTMNAASPEGFDFSADRIVKAGLVVLKPDEGRFHVESLTKGNRALELEQIWPRFKQAMTIAARLLAQFGLAGRALPAQNVVIPLVYYSYHRNLSPSYVTANSHERDRRKVRAFVARTLLRRGFWTGAVDPVLVASCKAIKKHGSAGFPLAEIASDLSGVKIINVDQSFIDELAGMRYGDRRTIVLLRLLFPHMVHDGLGANGLDKDHIFPISQFSPAVKRPDGLTVDNWVAMQQAGGSAAESPATSPRGQSGWGEACPNAEVVAYHADRYFEKAVLPAICEVRAGVNS